jgi:catechol 2,3-dioxygenase-like lactoylglutathione lyase family enzyme
MASLNHLHLHARDLAASRRFYESWFGFREHCWHGEILFLRDDAGLDLALAPDPAPAPLPPWFHIGFRLSTAEAARALHARMSAAAAGSPGPLHDAADLVFFRVQDPAGVPVDVYWE